MPDLNATIKFINAVMSNWCSYTIGKRIMAIKLNDPNYYPTVLILLLYKPESVNETQELFNSIPITTDITISKSILAQDQLNNYEQFSNITKTKIKIPESLISLSSEYLIKNESDIDTLIFYLQEKFQMLKKN
ncbi:1018_t:CDS:2 [Cetraspora pellucida]|uniref:1018_t:CDS:1 n=1 Tax=Cetraspora pellucida TaxID=1433469 RepID=A0ACA9L5T7_9GLOM|nr:1018_t:CDS:2 [Cetraspora pellucida]